MKSKDEIRRVLDALILRVESYELPMALSTVEVMARDLRSEKVKDEMHQRIKDLKVDELTVLIDLICERQDENEMSEVKLPEAVVTARKTRKKKLTTEANA